VVARKFIDAENIAELDIFAQAKVDIVAENREVSEGKNPPGYTAVDCRYALIADQLKGRRVEDLLARIIQFAKSLQQV
jgi:hypothetical protein